MGEALRELGRYREAIYPLRRSAELMPDDIRVWLSLGWCYKRTGHLDRAIEALEQALDFDPAEAVLHYNLACYWSLAHDRGRALDYLARALDMDSNFRDLVPEEPDFDPLRSDPGFKLLTSVVV
jgi:Flp pilus assembly protein TadD